MKVAVTSGEPSLDAAVDPRFGRCACFLIVETDDLTFEAVENPNVSLGGGAGIQSAQLMSEKGVAFVLTGNCGPNAFRTLAAAGVEVITGCSGTVREVVAEFRAGGLTTTGGPNVAGHFGMGASAATDEATASTPSPDQTTAPATSPAAEPDQRESVVPDAANPEGLGSGAGGVGPGMGQRRGGGQGGGMGRGMGQGRGRGLGQGRGRGMGQGRGRGMGRGTGQGRAAGRGAAFDTAQPTPPDAPASPGEADELGMLKQQAEQLGRQMQDILERIRQLEEGQ
jgi:predicted Fe-Mo cluster-binding NifX family protein